jgi:hypothetical protein
METQETPDELVAQNVANLRRQRAHTVRTLSEVLTKLGRPILPSGITKIENQNRKVSPGDLVVLAIALGVHPNRLLLPVDDREVELTPVITTSAREAWEWATGSTPLVSAEPPDSARNYAELEDDFRRHSLPVPLRLREDHTGVKAARDVLRAITLLVDRRENPNRQVDDDEAMEETGAELAAKRGRAYEPSWSPAGLRRELQRLIAEVDALIGDDDGQR